jgi:3-hydroxyacyl-[acyl-carrier-protein] dehydratase
MARYAKETPWDIDYIRSVLPHRYPFLLIDRVKSLVQAGTDDNREGTEIFGVKNVTANEAFFQGHFPQRPIMPGVLIIEALAQACALICTRPLPPGTTRWDVYIVGIKEAKFRRPVVPGDQLELYGKILRDRPSLNLFHAEARVDGQIAAECEIQAKMIAV